MPDYPPTIADLRKALDAIANASEDLGEMPEYLRKSAHLRAAKEHLASAFGEYLRKLAKLERVSAS